MRVACVAALDARGGIGKNGGIPWHLARDFRHFRLLTTVTTHAGDRNAVIMGRRTWDSLPSRAKPLPKRLNLVVSRQHALPLPDDVLLAQSLPEALDQARERRVATAFIIGGGEIFRQAFTRGLCSTLYLTEIEKDFQCDVFFPEFSHDAWICTQRRGPFVEQGIAFSFCTYTQKPSERTS